MKTTYKIVLAVVSVIAVAGVLFGLYMYNLKPKDLQKVKPDFVVTAPDLIKAFETDENAATAKYVNNIVEVSGTIQSVKPGENNALTISLNSGNDISSVICTLQGNTEPNNFRPGEQIIIRGTCSGFLMDVLLNNCAVVQVNN
jgi:cytochrome c-type biogenesis protein CcmE